MKRVKVLLVIAVLLGVVGLSVGDAMATWYYNATVEQVGQGGSNVMIRLSSSTEGLAAAWFPANATYKKEMLATALTAQVNTSLVTVNIVSGVVQTIYMR